MLIDSADNSAPETTPEPATAAPAAHNDANANPANESPVELDEIQAIEDEIEEELEGVKLKGKKEALERIKAERQMHQDYTRKTMSLADERKSFESDREAFRQTAQIHSQLTREYAAAHAMDAQLQQYQQVNWAALIEQDPKQAQILQAQQNQLLANRQQLGALIAQRQQQMQQAEQQEIAKLARDAQQFLMRELKDWSDVKDRELETFARSMGVDTKALSQFVLRNPQILRVIDAAYTADKASRQRAQAKPKPEPQKPVQKVAGSSASNTKAPSDMSMAEYAKWRRGRDSRTR